jgi:hypothetical protein
MKMVQSTASAEQKMVQPIAGAEQRKRSWGGRPWPKGVSGNPSGSKVSKRVAILFEALADELGGADLSATDRALLMQACRLLVRSERVKEAEDAVKCANAARRILASLRSRYEVTGSPPWSPLRAQLARSQQQPDAAVIAETEKTTP